MYFNVGMGNPMLSLNGLNIKTFREEYSGMLKKIEIEYKDE